MSIKETIEKASANVGSQRKLAELLGIPEQTLSNLKKGRPFSHQLHAQIAAAGGMEEEARRILLQGMADQLNESIPHEAEAKNGLLAILKAFPKIAKHKSSHAARFILQIPPKNRHFGASFFTRYQPLCS